MQLPTLRPPILGPPTLGPPTLGPPMDEPEDAVEQTAILSAQGTLPDDDQWVDQWVEPVEPQAAPPPPSPPSPPSPLSRSAWAPITTGLLVGLREGLEQLRGSWRR